MLALHIRGVDERLHRKLKARAAQHNRSVNQEVLAMLSETVDGSAGREEFKQLAARIRSLSAGQPQTPAEDLQRESRAER